ncbi:hypothetical protein [Streptomyces sp. NPDC059278]|uniref:hypothetical protein n=1 Tax=Streptomyces sp. NPDC059278 TaxID=3346801 RepID=UPI0036A49313
MSTRFVIARPNPEDPKRWTGVYGHSDGYPTGAGKLLHAHVVNEFNSDPEAAARHLIDAHPCGWAFLAEEFAESECYCHDRDEPEAIATETEKGAGGMDWTYVLRPEGLEVHRWDLGIIATVPWGQGDADWGLIERTGHATV